MVNLKSMKTKDAMLPPCLDGDGLPAKANLGPAKLPDPGPRLRLSHFIYPRCICKRQGKHTIDRFNRNGFAAVTTIDGMTTVPASSRIGLAKWKNSEGAR